MGESITKPEKVDSPLQAPAPPTDDKNDPDSSSSTDFTPLNSEDEKVDISPIKPKKSSLSRLKKSTHSQSDEDEDEQENILKERFGLLNKQLKTKKNSFQNSDDDLTD